ncbi:hypothetical protein [Halocatena halophila]|uniref:hypothetical protein n=1 Tax=Halocatena halophila TaxID=2814576 RepID=UPI002ED5A6E0
MAESDATEQVWFVERTYSDDEQNLIIITYATLDGSHYFRKERALTSFTDSRETTAAVETSTDNLGPVEDPERRNQYADAASRTKSNYDPDEIV